MKVQASGGQLLGRLGPVALLALLALNSISEPVECLADLLDLFKIFPSLDVQGKTIVPDSLGNVISRAGYKAEVFNIPTQPGIKINLGRIVNPMINRKSRTDLPKEPVLFIHGIWENANAWIDMAASETKPHDWTRKLNPAKATPEQIRKLAHPRDKVARSPAFLFSNFGYDCWLMNRRPTHGSRLASIGMHESQFKGLEGVKNLLQNKMGRLFKRGIVNETDMVAPKREDTKREKFSDLFDLQKNLKKLERKLENWLVKPLMSDYLAYKQNYGINKTFWDFSFDEQAYYDLPMTIDFILNKTGAKKLNIVGHSAGSLITLMTLASRPERASQIQHLSLMAPAVNLHYTQMENPSYKAIKDQESDLANFVGAFKMELMVNPLLNAVRCLQDKLKDKSCDTGYDEFYGRGTKQFLPRVLFMPENVVSFSSSGEIAQLLQSGEFNRMHYFDFRDPQKNQRRYGNLDVPSYDMSAITVPNITIWIGVSDRLVTETDTQTLLNELRVPYTLHKIGDLNKKIYFNHNGFHFHKNITRLLNIPVLIDVAQAQPISNDPPIPEQLNILGKIPKPLAIGSQPGAATGAGAAAGANPQGGADGSAANAGAQIPSAGGPQVQANAQAAGGQAQGQAKA